MDPIATNKDNSLAQMTQIQKLSAGAFLAVQVTPSGLVLILLEVPEEPVITNNDNSFDQQQPNQFPVTVLNVHVIPFGLVMT
jgi:hypothetical protein